MMRLVVTWLVALIVLVASTPCEFAAGSVGPAATTPATVTTGGSSSPAPGPAPSTEGPCMDGCLCPCGPGQVAPPPAGGLSILDHSTAPGSPRPLGVSRPPFLSVLHPRDLGSRIYRPPRIG